VVDSAHLINESPVAIYAATLNVKVNTVQHSVAEGTGPPGLATT
jgi:hypothetical protein